MTRTDALDNAFSACEPVLDAAKDALYSPPKPRYDFAKVLADIKAADASEARARAAMPLWSVTTTTDGIPSKTTDRGWTSAEILKAASDRVASEDADEDFSSVVIEVRRVKI
jgi:hypothetical protein